MTEYSTINNLQNNNVTSVIPACSRCHNPLGDRLVRALDGTFHPECFTCLDCEAPVAAMFFPFETPDGQTLPLCERDYFRRLDLVCGTCQEPLRGAYIIALDQKYHTDHFMCSACSTIFGPEDSYYEHEGKVYCHYHYSTQFAVMCAGCEMAILKQYVEIDKNDSIEHWHPECYMIHKFWSVKVRPANIISHQNNNQPTSKLLEQQHEMENKVYRIWQVLSTFEESSAMCISEMLLNVSNGAYIEGICLSERFLVHVEVLFSGIDELCKIQIENQLTEFKYTKESKMLCKKIINFFSLLSKVHEMDSKKLGITQELISLVTGLAHYLKVLIRLALKAALDMEYQTHASIAISRLLARLMEVAGKERHSRDSQRLFKSSTNSDICQYCHTTIEDECIKYSENRWHVSCFLCCQCKRGLTNDFSNAVFHASSQSLFCTSCTQHNNNNDFGRFQYVSRLSQYTFLLRVALSRLCSLLQISDQQLSSVEYSSKTKPYIKDIVKDGVIHTSEKQHQVPSATIEEKTSHFPTHITDVKNAVSLERKVSRSFKTAKRSTILGNVNMNQPTISEEDQPNEEEDEWQDVTQQQQQQQQQASESTKANRPPARLDSLLRRMDHHKDLPPLPQKQALETSQNSQFDQEQPSTPQHERRVSVGLDDVPMVSKQFMQQKCNAIKQPLSDPNSPFVPGTGMVSKCVISSTTGKPRVYLSELSALQYMIMRYVAVVQIEPYVREFFTHDELLQLIQLKKTSIWGKFFTPFKKPGVVKKQGKGKEEGTFGVPIEILTEKTAVESNLGAGASPIKIAGFVDDAITALRQMDMSIEGIFRKNGNIRRLKQVTDQLDRNPHEVDLSSENAVQIAALLKKWLRELPDPLLTFRLHRLFICSQRIDNVTIRKRVLHLACCMLPRCNRDTMEVMFLFFRWVALFSHVTSDIGSKMDIPNLARVIAPNILYTTSKDPLKDESFLAINSVEMLLESYEEFCMVPEDLEPFIQDNDFQDGKGDMSSKDFLKRVELLMKKKAVNPTSGASSTADLRLATADLRLATADLRISTSDNRDDSNYLSTTTKQPQQQQQQHLHSHPHPPNISTSSIYAQQQYLPYPNRHPSSDFVPSPIATTRHSSLHNHNPSPTSPNTTTHMQQHYYASQQQPHQQWQQHPHPHHHQPNMTHTTSPTEYSPSPLRLPQNQQELHS